MVDNDAIYSQLWDSLNKLDVDDVISILRQNDVNIDYRHVSHDLQTFLMRVCYVNLETSDMLDVLTAVFDLSPDVNIQDSWGRSVLMHACIANKPILIEGLLEYESTDVTLVDFDGNSALSYAVQNCDSFTIEDLLQQPCGPSLLTRINSKGQSPYTIAQKSGDKTILKLFDSYIDKTESQEKKQKRKPRNRDVIKLPPAYSPSPERNARSSKVQYSSSPECNTARYGAKYDMKIDINAAQNPESAEHSVAEKCGSAPVNSSRGELVSSLSLSSPKFIRRHHRQDCLLQETLLLNQSRHFPQMKSENRTAKTNELDLPEYSLRKQRRPSLSLPDLRNMKGFLVNSGSSTPTTDGESRSKNSSPTRDEAFDDNEDDVFTQSCPDTSRKSRQAPNFVRQLSEKQITLPEINKGKTNLMSPANTRRGVVPLVRNRKYSNSDDQLHRLNQKDS